MKDIKDIEIKSGQKVHIFGKSKKDDEPIDINCIVFNTRGRGIKFVNEVTAKEYTKDYIEEHGYSVHVLTDVAIPSTGEKKKIKCSSNVIQDELDLIEKLKEYGWSGTIHKTAGDTQFTIKLPEYENRN